MRTRFAKLISLLLLLSTIALATDNVILNPRSNEDTVVKINTGGVVSEALRANAASARVEVGRLTGPAGAALTLGADFSSQFFANSAIGRSLFFDMSRNPTFGSHTIVQSGDQLGSLTFRGSDGSSFRNAASISAVVDATPGLTDMPGRLVFSTSPDGSATLTEVGRVSQAGIWTLGSSTSTVGHVVNGSGLALTRVASASNVGVSFTNDSAGTPQVWTSGLRGDSSNVYAIVDNTAGQFRFQIAATTGQTSIGLNSVTGQLIKGVTNGGGATAGFVGEYIEAKNVVSTNFGTSGSYSDANNIVLTAGDWDISFVLLAKGNGATSTAIVSFIGTVAGNNTTGALDGDNQCSVPAPGPVVDSTCTIPNYRVNISSTTTYYLKVRADFSAGTPQYRYRFSARRIR